MRDNNSIRVSRSLRDTAYKAIYAKEGYMKRNLREPTLQEISEEIGIAKEDIVFAMDAIQAPMSLNEPVYNDGGDALYVMDQISDKKIKKRTGLRNWRFRQRWNIWEREKNILSDYVFLRGAPRWKLRRILIFPRHR